MDGVGQGSTQDGACCGGTRGSPLLPEHLTSSLWAYDERDEVSLTSSAEESAVKEAALQPNTLTCSEWAEMYKRLQV